MSCGDGRAGREGQDGELLFTFVATSNPVLKECTRAGVPSLTQDLQDLLMVFSQLGSRRRQGGLFVSQTTKTRPQKTSAIHGLGRAGPTHTRVAL